jgi:hypothetical protein
LEQFRFLESIAATVIAATVIAAAAVATAIAAAIIAIMGAGYERYTF